MKVRITMKDPDGAGESIDDAVIRSVKDAGITHPEEARALYEVRRELVGDACAKFLDCGEYLTVEIDTVEGTAVVVPCKA